MEESSVATGDLTFALPGNWWRIPLVQEDETEQAVRAYVEAMVGRADDKAQVRHDLRAHLAMATDEARRGAGQEMFLASEMAPGVPLAVTMVTYLSPLPERLTDSASLDEKADSFAGSLRAEDDQADIDVWVGDEVAVVREMGLPPLTSKEGEQEFNLRVRYWLMREGPSQSVMFTFSTPLIWEEQRDAVLEMFDAIIGTVDWELTEVAG